MRWSLISSVSVVALSLASEVHGLPAPLPASDGLPSEDALEIRGFRIPRIPRIPRLPSLPRIPGFSRPKPSTPKSPSKAAPPAPKKASPASKPNTVVTKPKPSNGRTARTTKPKPSTGRATRVTKPKKVSGPVTAKELKSSSRTYRNAAAKSKNGVFKPGTGGRLKKHRGNGKVQKGLQADHIVEAQTVAHAINKAGRHPSRAAMRGAKKIVNSPENMAFVDRKTNNRKGKDTSAALRGRPTSRDKNVQTYLRGTKAPGESVAKKLDDHFRKHRTPVDVQGTHKQVLKGNGIKRRDLTPESDEVIMSTE